MPAKIPISIRILAATGVLAIVTTLATIIFLFYAADWLREQSAPTAADAVVVLAGPTERALYAAELFKAGYAHQILVSRPAREQSLLVLDKLGIAFPQMDEIYREVLVRSGVPADRIRFFGSGSTSTYEEAKALADLTRDTRPALLVVTSPYHVRRAAMILHGAEGLAAARIVVVGTPYESFPARWWTSQDAARNLLLELVKIAFYRMGGRFEAQAEGAK